MPHPPHRPASMICALAIPEACPPGEGTVQVDKIFWGPSKSEVYAAGAMLTAEIFVPERGPPDAHVFGFRARESRPCQVAPADQQV
jgi:hypothetical protein